MGVVAGWRVRPAEAPTPSAFCSHATCLHPIPRPFPLEGKGRRRAAAEALWAPRGISGEPTAVVEGKWLISGGQPAGVFEEALRKISEEG